MEISAVGEGAPSHTVLDALGDSTDQFWSITSRRHRLRGVALRVALPVFFTPVVLVFAPAKGVLLACLAGYLLLAAAGAMLEIRGKFSDIRINLFLVLDTVLVLLAAYASGLQTSPVLTLLGTLVIAYTLQRGIRTGLVAIVLIGVLYAVGLWLEAAGAIPIAPLIPPGHGNLAITGGPIGAWSVTGIALAFATWLIVLAIGRVERRHRAVNLAIEAERAALDEAAKMSALAHEVQMLESLGRMAGGMAHEFNNLLTVILGYSRLAAEDLADPECRADLEQVAQAANRGKRLVSQLLSYSQKRPGDFETLDLTAFVSASLPMLQQLLRADIHLRTEVGSQAVKVRGDRMWLEQALVNLVTNAVAAMDGGGDLTLAVELAGGGQAKLSVIDTGHGMNEEILQSAPDAFFTTKPAGQGTGLGLSVVRDVVERHQGTLQIDSEPGRGTQVIIGLPVVEGDLAVQPEAESEVAGGQETILLVEDEPLVRDVARRALLRWGYEPLVTEDAEAAQSLFDQDPDRVDLLLTDVILPGRSGRELADSIRAARPDLPVLFTSGYSDEALAKLGFFGAKVDLLRKPFSLQDMAAKIRALLDADDSN